MRRSRPGGANRHRPFLLLRLAPAAGSLKPWRRPLTQSVTGT
jgi:hypothetical protein